MKVTLSVASLLVPLLEGAEPGKFLYNDQAAWPTFPAIPLGSNQCNGKQQSPVNLNSDEYACKPDIAGYQFFAGDCTLGDYHFTINDHGVKASVEKAICEKPKMISPGTDKVYEIIQFHIHTGCENKFNEQGCDAELHMVHLAQTGLAVPRTSSEQELPDLAVYGIMLNGVDEHHEAFDSLIDSWKAVACSTGNCTAASSLSAILTQPFSPYSLIPTSTDTYNFQGSLTTPPCWEVVNWNLAEAPMRVSFRQILAITNLIIKYSGYRSTESNTIGQCVDDISVVSIAGLSGRDTHPLNDRDVVKNCETIQIDGAFPALLSVTEDVKSGTEPAPSSAALFPALLAAVVVAASTAATLFLF